MRGPLLIDCDPGVDDAIALMLAFAAGLDVRAVTTVAGNVALASTAANARRIVTLCGRDVPVHAGCPRPILVPPVHAAHVHGDDGLAGLPLPPPATALAPMHGVDALVDGVMAAPEPPLVATLGPLTNLALAIVKVPEVATRVREIVIMGGAIGSGNVTPAAEFNIFADPHAAAVVFASGAPLTMIGLDATRHAAATPARIAALAALGSRTGAAAAAMLRAQAATGDGAPLIHDACVIAWALAPDLFTTIDATVSVVTEDGADLGRTVVAPGGRARVATAVDGAGLFAMLEHHLARL